MFNQSGENSNISVFISYAWDGDIFNNWVQKLCVHLTSNGITTYLDQYKLQPGYDLQKYMTDEINLSNWIIVILTNKYLERLAIPTSGVRKEFDLIIKYIKNKKVIPVLINFEHSVCPNELKDLLYIDFTKESDYEKNMMILINSLYEKNKMLSPSIGKSPFDKSVGLNKIFNTNIQRNLYIKPDLKGSVNFDYSNNNGKYIIGTGEFEFITKWSRASNNSIHTYNDELKGGIIGLYKNLNDLQLFTSSNGIDFTTRTRTAMVGDGVVLINNIGNMAVLLVKLIKDSSRFDKVDEVAFDYIILGKPI